MRFILRKSFAIFLLISLFTEINAQIDSVKIDNNTNDVILVSDTITQLKIVNDTIPDQSLSGDSVKLNGISSDAVDQVIEYNSKDSILFSLTNEKMYLYGIGDISATDMNLNSAYVEISTAGSYLYSESVLDSSGNNYKKPILEQDDETFTVKSIKYNFKTKKAIVKDVKTEQEQGYLHSDKAKMQTNKEFHIKSGKFTTCDLDHPHFYIKLTKAKKIPDKHVISGPMYFVIADIPLYIIGLPFGMLPNQKKNTSGLIIPEYGEEVRRGFFFRNGGYFWAVNDHINASLLGDIYSKGSWGLTLKSNFKKKYKYSGNLEVKYNINRTEEKILDSSKVETFWVNGSYMQDSKANPNSTFSASLNFGSSVHSSYNAIDINEYTDNQKSSNLSYRWSKPGSIFNFSANIRASQNTKSRMINLDLPTVSLNMQRQFPFKNLGSGTSKWYQKIGFTINVNAKNSINTGDSILFTRQTLYNMKNGLKYTVPISTSFKLLNYITVSPAMNFTGRLYSNKVIQYNILLPQGDDVINEIGYDTVPQLSHPFDFNISIPFSTKVYGIVEINKGNVQAIRHVLSTSLSFSYNPDFSEEMWGFFGTINDPDSLERTLKYSYYDKFLYGAPTAGRSGSIGLNIGNNLEMKLKSKNDTVQESRKVKLIDNLSLSASYNLAADSFNLSYINISGNTKLFKNFGLRVGASFDPYSMDTVTGGRINKFAIIDENNKKLARFRYGSISLTGSLKPKKDKESSGYNFLNPENEFYYYPYPDIPYADFDLPWNLSLNYSFKIYNNYDTLSRTSILDYTQTVSLNGSISLTKNWQISANTTYDFSARKFSYAQFTINRDLHCWEMSFNVIPFGTMKSYSFRINIKASIFKGVEYNKKKAWQDNLY